MKTYKVNYIDEQGNNCTLSILAGNDNQAIETAGKLGYVISVIRGHTWIYPK